MTQAQRRPVQARWWTLLLVVLQAVLVGLIARYTWPSTSRWHTTDIQVYFNAARALAAGQLPYRDFVLEYPPLALVSFALPLLAAGGPAAGLPAYVQWFSLQNLLLSSLVALGIAQVLAPLRPARPWAALVLYAFLAALVAPLLLWRYDLFPALLTLLGLRCLQRDQPTLAGWWLGCGVVLKVYPLVLLPIFALYYGFSGQRKAVVRLAVGSCAAILGVMLPLLLLASDDLFVFLRYHQQRGLQIESLPAGALLLGHQLGWVNVDMAYTYGALHLISPYADGALRWLPFAFIAVFAVVLARSAVWFHHERATTGAISEITLVQSCAAALLAFIATNKVLSPQYLIWLLPFAPLLRVRYVSVLGLICGLTTLLFPFMYQGLLDLQSLPVLLLNLRNLLVVVLLVWLLQGQPANPWWALRTSAASASRPTGSPGSTAGETRKSPLSRERREGDDKRRAWRRY